MTFDQFLIGAALFLLSIAPLAWGPSDPAATELLHHGVGVFRFDPSVPDPGCS